MSACGYGIHLGAEEISHGKDKAIMLADQVAHESYVNCLQIAYNLR